MKNRGTKCSTPDCTRRVFSQKGRTKCRECHRKTVVWANPSNQRNNQCVGFAEPTPAPRAKEMSVEDSGSHLMSLLRVVGALDFSPVKRYFKCSLETAELFQRYAA